MTLDEEHLAANEATTDSAEVDPIGSPSIQQLLQDGEP